MKKIVWLMLVLMLLLPATAMAHSKLETAVPAKESVVEVSPESISMTFNTKIEKLSTFKLFNSADEQQEVKDIAVDGAILTGQIPLALANGEYTVKWTIIGADGHSVNGEYTFEVKAEVVEATPEPSEEPEASKTAESEVSASPEPSATDSEAPATNDSVGTDKQADEKKSNSALFIIGGVAVIVLIALIVGVRRKK